MKKCTQCGQFIPRKISKIGAIICQNLRLKYTKFSFRWGSAPDPSRGDYSALSDAIDVFKGSNSKGEQEKGRRVRNGEGRE